jgi:hypothetical protein
MLDDTIAAAAVSPEFLPLTGTGAGEIRRPPDVQFNAGVVKPLAAVAERPWSLFPEEHWIDLREHLVSLFLLAHLKNL